MNSNIIPIFFACDNGFVKYTMVSLKSLMMNADRDRQYNIHILNTGIDDDKKQVVLDMADDVIKQDADMRILEDERYLEIFRMVDYSICGIELDKEKPYSKTIIIRNDENSNLFRRELQMDSTGVREFFAWAVHIFRVVYENKIVFADEMDRVLNPILSDRVIAFVNGAEHNGQFIFSTHNVLHLDLKTYMKEQIYFVTKNREQLTSEMYSLSDFPEVRYETTKIYEFYMKGILGGTASP